MKDMDNYKSVIIGLLTIVPIVVNKQLVQFHGPSDAHGGARKPLRTGGYSNYQDTFA